MYLEWKCWFAMLLYFCQSRKFFLVLLVVPFILLACKIVQTISNSSSSYSVFIWYCPFSRDGQIYPQFLLQLLALRPSTCLVSGHPLFSNQSSLFPLPLASSRSSLIILAFSCHSLQDLEKPSKHYRHPSSVHVHTI